MLAFDLPTVVGLTYSYTQIRNAKLPKCGILLHLNVCMCIKQTIEPKFEYLVTVTNSLHAPNHSNFIYAEEKFR